MTEALSAVVKKGKRSWRPAAHLDILKKDPNKQYRWCDKDPANLIRKQAEGWRFSNAEHVRPEYVDDGTPLTSTTEHRELVAMEIDVETVAARKEYHDERTNAFERAIMRNAKADIRKLNPEAEAHGKIIIE